MSARDLRAQRVVGAARRTYACLEGQRRKPTDYEITSTALLYYPGRGFAVDTPVGRHALAQQQSSRLRWPRWDDFEDPAHTTYSSYVAARRDQEAFLDHLFEKAAPLEPPSSSSLEPLLALVSALRFPLHGMQMTSAYVGSLAPSGRIAIVSALQAADELRRIQRLCQWLGGSGKPMPQLDALGRALWQSHASLQPLRRLIETMLVTYDWSEAMIALNGVLKPLLEPALAERLAALAEQQGAELLAQCLRSSASDAAWHARWFERLSEQLCRAEPANVERIAEYRQRLEPAAREATRALLLTLGGGASEGSAALGDTV